jgi:uncharacterized protein (DUF1778 family)
MATPLQVPGEYEGGLAKIRDLPDDSVRELVTALQQIPDTYSQSSLSSAVASNVETIAANDVREMVPTLLSLYAYRDYSQSAISDVAEDIAQAMVVSETDRLRLRPEDREAFTKRLAELLDVEPFNRVVRAGTLLLENERTFRNVRVLSDIRPVFEPDKPDAPPKAGVIQHTLKFSYRADNTTKEFSITLDGEDVDELMDQLERAKTKGESLRSVLKAAQMLPIEPK